MKQKIQEKDARLKINLLACALLCAICGAALWSPGWRSRAQQQDRPSAQAGSTETPALDIKSSKIALLNVESIQDKNIISNNLAPFAVKHGITTVFDGTQLLSAILTLDPAIDITKDFIAGSLNTNIPESRIAFVNTEAFGDQKSGIKTYVKAVKQLENEFRSRAEGVRNSSGSEYEKKKKEYEAALEKRYDEVVGPISAEIGKGLVAFARQNGITLILDADKLLPAILTLDPAMDVTKAFVTAYNEQTSGTRVTGETASVKAPASKIAFVNTDIFKDQQAGILKYIEAIKKGKSVDKISKDIGQSLTDFARQNGITLILDISKLTGSIKYSDEQLDVTRIFISHFNKNQ
jgi:Skp family chaperone for outer membrane proteins